MRIVPTVLITDGSGGSIVINASDFDPDRHERFVETPHDDEPVEAQASDGPGRQAERSTDTKGQKGTKGQKATKGRKPPRLSSRS